MIRALGRLPSSQKLLIFGLSNGNLRLLKEDRPIMFSLDPQFGIDASVLIMWGVTEDAIKKRLLELGTNLSGAQIGELSEAIAASPGGAEHGVMRAALGDDGNVVVAFGQKVEGVKLSRNEAMALAQSLLTLAGQADP